jgi:hypothetical protein
MIPSSTTGVRLAGVLLAVLALSLTRGPSSGQRTSEGIAGTAPSPTDPGIAEVADHVNRILSEEWTARGLHPTPRAPELLLARRASLGLRGTPPSLEEIREIEGSGPPLALPGWVTRILADRRSSDYLAERLARPLVDIEDGPFLIYRRHRLVGWMSDQILANRPFGETVRRMLMAEGIWTAEPAVNFLTAAVDPDAPRKGPDEEKLGGRVARAFLGVRLDCVQCHDDKFGGRWRQADFQHLAAFFAQPVLSLGGIWDDPSRRYEVRFPGKTAREAVTPAVPFLPELLPSGGRLRERLAGWVTHPENQPFSRTLVNRLWALLVGRPLVEPIDSIPLDGPPNPVLDLLARDFSAHGHDLHRLVRVITSTVAFQRDSRSAPGAPPPSRADEAGFAAFPLTRLRPEQVASGILQGCRVRTLGPQSGALERISGFFQRREFIQRYGDAGRHELEDDRGTVTQRLLVMNGDLLRDRTHDNLLLNAASRIGFLAPSPEQAVEASYLAVLTRRPTPEETRQCALRLRDQSRGTFAQRMEDLYWMLLNSTESNWNH